MEELPFYSFWQEFVDDNVGRDKELNILIGIGTSGVTNPKQVYNYLQDKLTKTYKNKAFFILLIDGEYKKVDERDISMGPFLKKIEIPDGPTFGFSTIQDAPENERYVKAKDLLGNYLYIWGENLPTAYNHLEKFGLLRNSSKGPYAYGKDCEPIERPREFYNALLAFFSKDNISNIYVFNQAHQNSSGYIRSRTQKYTGDLFRNELRILRAFDGNPLGANEIRSSMIGDGMYFDRFCEFLHILWKSQKPIYILTDMGSRGAIQEERIYQRAPNQGGRRKTKKSKRSKRSQSRRRRTIYALGFK